MFGICNLQTTSRGLFFFKLITPAAPISCLSLLIGINKKDTIFCSCSMCDICNSGHRKWVLIEIINYYCSNEEYFLVISTVCPRSSDPLYVVTYYIKWVNTSWTHISKKNRFLMQYQSMLDIRKKFCSLSAF